MSSFEGSGVRRTGKAQSTVEAVKSDPCYSTAYHSPSFKWIRFRVCLHRDETRLNRILVRFLGCCDFSRGWLSGKHFTSDNFVLQIFCAVDRGAERRVVGLRLVSLQLSLFPWRPDCIESGIMGQDDPLRGRTVFQFLRSVAAYCEWRAASMSLQRFNGGRRDYLDAAALALDVVTRATRPELVKIPPQPAPTAAELRIAAMPRFEMASRIAAVNPSLNPKLLARLPKPKLAKMLAAAGRRATA